ncbi:uncharacterized protein B0H18DRAFT_981776 [Fomitopsis serialis]|uniref:uncharacterized protein n=1 Tax=Fomitopsis serialis TaxID=139415 RepID=UPI0020085DF9|nr:uncharacterized protein B0H18DRAFT_981776 [Neoantrodia serialis]KAH9933729.1 hypothetical protein B0H18DRAFT_981776 [Neoantrodia serialis]
MQRISESQRMDGESHRLRLPFEIVQPLFLDAIEGDRSLAAALSQTCKTVHTWIIPILYSTVVLTKSTQAALFKRTLLTSFNSESDGQLTAAGPNELLLHTYVRHLWVGRKRHPSQLGETKRERIGQTVIGRSRLWDATLEIVKLCPSLRTLAMIGYPAMIIKWIVPHLPVTLQSLSICVRDNVILDLPDISHLTALRDITSVHTELSGKTVCLLLRSPSVQSITRLYNCSRPIPPGSGFPPESRWKILGMGVYQLSFVDMHTSRGFKRMRIVSLFGRDASAETELSGLQQFTEPYTHDPRIVVSAEEGYDESGVVDHIKTCCVPRTQEHPTWDL